MLLSKWTLFSFVSTSLLLLNLPTAWANEKDGCPQRTLVLPDRTKYEQLCGLKVGKDNAKAKWPCFNAYYRDPSREYFPAHLNNALVTANKGIDPAKALIFSDGEFSEFTPLPEVTQFKIKLYDFGVTMDVRPHLELEGCYHVDIEYFGPHDYIMLVSDGRHDVDLYKSNTSSNGPICSRWVLIVLLR